MDSLDPCECLDKALVSLLGMNDILREDLNALLDVFPDQGNQVLRRSVVRASWAYAEAITHAIKLMTSIVVDAAVCKLEPDEMVFLRNQKSDTLTNIKETIKVAAKVFDLSERNLGGGSDWCHVKPSLRIRDRLIHPKSVEDLQVSDSEWETHRQGFNWLVHAFDGLLTDMSDKYSQNHGCTSAPTQ